MSWLTWEAIKLFMKKAWVWCKHHWKIIAIAVWTIAVWLIARKNAKSMMKVMEAARKSYEDELDVINRTHAEEREKKAEALDDYHSVIDSIEEKYQEEKRELSSEKKDRIKKLVDSYDGDRKGLNSALKEEFGFEHVE